MKTNGNKAYMQNGEPRFIRCFDNDGSFHIILDRSEKYGQVTVLRVHPDANKSVRFLIDVRDMGAGCFGVRVEFTDMPRTVRNMVVLEYIEKYGSPCREFIF